MDLGEVFLDICGIGGIDCAKMRAVDLMELEIGRHRWPEMACGCRRSAAHLPDDLRRMVRATEEPQYGFFVDDHIWEPEVIFEPAVPAASVMVAALAGTEMTEVARYYILHNLLCLVGDLGQAPSERDLVQECQDLVRTAEWLFYSLIAARPGWRCASTAFEILDVAGADRERLRALITADPELLGRDLCEEWSVTA